MKICPAKIVRAAFHFPITHAVCVGNTDVAYFGDLKRADFVKEAINYYRKSKECERYWIKMKKEGK